MNRIHVGLIGLSVALAGGTALAHGGRGHMKGMDENGDGKVTLKEAQAKMKARFQERDANKNGVLEQDELGGRGHKLLERADGNSDGKITSAEAEAASKAFFQKCDANKDGALTRDELGKGHHDCDDKEHGKGHEKGHGGGHEGRGQGPEKKARS